MNELTVGTAVARRGERSDGALVVARLADASPVAIPVAVLHGARPGPCLWVQSGVHGNEFVGMGAMHRLLRRLDPRDMAGSAVFVPTANIMAYRILARSALQDGVDMNRIWPGAPVGTARHVSAHTEIVAHQLFQYIDTVADAVLDCHTGGWPNIMAPWAAYVQQNGNPIARDAERLAMSTGLEVVWRRKESFMRDKVQGSIMTLLTDRGKPVVVLESGGEGRIDPDTLAYMERAVENCLKVLGITPGLPEVPRQPRLVVEGHWLRASEGGMWRRRAELLTEVRHGELIGEITDLIGKVLEQVRAPADGIIIGIRTLAICNSGEYLGNVSQLA